MSLTPKQARFVEEYLIDLNATQAAIRAGYSKKTAYSQGQRLLKKVEVAAYIQAAQIEVSRRAKIAVDDVVTGLLAEAEGRADSTPSSRVAAWSQLGRHLGMFNDRLNLEAGVGIVELMARIDGRTRGLLPGSKVD